MRTPLLPTPKFAWVSLDAGDNHPVRFLRYPIAAMQTIETQVGPATQGLLQSPQSPPLESMLTVLINELCSLPCQVALVLDDYHLISAADVHQAVAFLLEHLPPQVHLVLLTRADPPLPLNRLRARNQLAEFRAAHLRFTTDEAAAFLNQVMGLGRPPTIWQRWRQAPRAGLRACNWRRSHCNPGLPRRHARTSTALSRLSPLKAIS